MHDWILILDFGSQYTQLIARRIRELGVYCEIHPCTEAPGADDPRLKGVVLSGGPASVYDDDAPPFHPAWLERDVPILGICYGMQLMAQHLGGAVEGAEHREYGHADLQIPGDSPLFAGMQGPTPVWMSHGDRVSSLPPGFGVVAHSQNCPVAAMAHQDGRRFGIQFHPEVTHSHDGKVLLHNFVRTICGAHNDWSMASFVDEQIAHIREKVGTDHVMCALSGGVDSAVVAALLHKAIGDQLHCFFVDNGVLRLGERVSVEQEFAELDLEVVDAAERFLDALQGVEDPETKRKIIGEVFIRVFEEEARHLKDLHGEIRWLAQGTLYPDVIESISYKGPSATIKSHHNVGGLPDDMDLDLIEPLRELFKDEVRDLGRALGLSKERVGRHPFPGPGMAVRILGAVDAESVALLQRADAIVQDEIVEAGLYDHLWQVFSVLLPVKSVGVMGDSRTYEQACVIRAVHSLDGMTASVAELPWGVLTRMSTRIINEVRGINRVCYDISTKPPATIEWE